jgi:two-component system, NarL family, sensor histidine kinase DesK
VTRELAGPERKHDPEHDSTRETRRAAIVILILLALGGPTLHLLRQPLTGLAWFQFFGTIVFAALAIGVIFRTPVSGTPVARALGLAVILPLGIALFVAAGSNGDWVGALAIAAAVSARGWRSPVPAIVAATACAVAGVAVAVHYHYGGGNTLSVALIGPLAGFLSYTTTRRLEALESLRRTRAELARAAVAEERLRIARDLHDLLGHSLSLITLKAQLAGRVVSTDPERATREIGELEAVARQSLSDVRAAVAGFRQPDLSGELVAATQLLDAAGISCTITSPDYGVLPQDVDAVLAWAVREGATNVVRHSRATKVAISVSARPSAVVAEISDNGPAAPDQPGRPAVYPGAAIGANGHAAVARSRPAFGGSGLAGLAERVRSLGGELAAGRIEPNGFLLRVAVPLRQQA